MRGDRHGTFYNKFIFGNFSNGSGIYSPNTETSITQEQFKAITKTYPPLKKGIFQKSTCPTTFQVVQSTIHKGVSFGYCPNLLKKQVLEARDIMTTLDQYADEHPNSYVVPKESEYIYPVNGSPR